MFLDPEEILGHLPTRAGMRVGDFGAGAGAYAYALAEGIPEGQVYAFEVLPELVEGMARKGHTNLFPLTADLNAHIPLRDHILDAAVIINTLHALRERERFLSELNRVMAPGARALVVDWVASFKNMGPTEERVITPSEAARLFESQGFSTGGMLPAGTHHYAFIARKH